MKVEVKQTNELTELDIKQYCKCHEIVFERPSNTQSFLQFYKNTCLGFSYHALLYDNDVIVGGYSLIPFVYEVLGEKKLFAYASALMIEKEYRRDFANLFGLVKAMLNTAKNNFSCIYIFPNDNADIVNKQLIKAKRIGELNTYILPYKLDAYKKSLRYLNPLTKLFSNLLLWGANLSDNKDIYEPQVIMNRDDFINNRLHWSNYSHYNDYNMSATWKVAKFEGIEAAFLIDIYPISKNNFKKAVRMMYEKEKQKVGIFLYVGLLPFKPCSMIKVPKKFEPKKFRFDVKIFDESLSQDIILNPNNWDINLSSYDLL